MNKFLQRMKAPKPKLTKLRHNILVYIASLFAISRILYVIIGDISIRVFNQYVPSSLTAYPVRISKYLPIQMWYPWDSVHYGNLARLYNFSLSPLKPTLQHGGKGAYYMLHWFPLYPIAGKLVHLLMRISIPYSLLMISNLCFLASLYLIYKLVRFDGEDDGFARRVVAIVILLPTSFIFSAALSESFFLLLAVTALYFARTQRWIMAGLFGFLLALTRSEGFLIVIPLLAEALQQYGFKLRNVKRYTKPAIAISVTVLGVLSFMLYSWVRTKDVFAYVHSQQLASSVSLGNPFSYLFHNLLKFRTLIVLGELAIIASVWRKLRWSYLAYAVVFTFITLAVGNSAAASVLRYISVVFPVAIGVGYLMKKQTVANTMWIGLGLLNGALFILWVNWWTGFII